MFDPKSRYAKLTTYTRTDHRGRTVMVVPAPSPPADALLGIHVLRQGERIDHLACDRFAAQDSYDPAHPSYTPCSGAGISCRPIS